MRVVLSPPELESLGDLLTDSGDRVVSVKRQADSILDWIGSQPRGALGAAADDIDQAVRILDQITGPSGLHRLVGDLYHDEMFVRHSYYQARRADQLSTALTLAQRQLLQMLARNGVSKATLARDRAEMLARDRSREGKGHGVTVVG